MYAYEYIIYMYVADSWFIVRIKRKNVSMATDSRNSREEATILYGFVLVNIVHLGECMREPCSREWGTGHIKSISPMKLLFIVRARRPTGTSTVSTLSDLQRRKFLFSEYVNRLSR